MQKPGLFGMNGLMVFLLTFFSVAAHAQQPGSLILIDADNKQPFTVRVGDQLYSSSGHGHLVLSHLKDTLYKLNLRFPKRNVPEQVFPVWVRQKDQGFLLKGSDTTWFLYNWQNRETIHAIYDRDSTRMLEQGVKREDGFSKLMAAVVNDSSVMYNTYLGSGFDRGPVPVIPVKNSKPDPAVGITDRRVGKNTAPGGKRPTPVKDSLAAAKKAAMFADSIAAVRYRATNDSLLALKKANFEKDSLQAITKTAALAAEAAKASRSGSSDDEVAQARKASRDSLAAARRMVKDSLAAAKKARADSISLARKQRNDSLAAVKTARKDSIALAKNTLVTKEVPVASTAAAAPQPAGMVPVTREEPPVQASNTAVAKPLSHVKKLREISLKVSRKIVYLDIGPGGIADTVTLFVYFEPNAMATAKKPVTAATAGRTPGKMPVTEAPALTDTMKSETAKGRPVAGSGGASTSALKTVAKGSDAPPAVKRAALLNPLVNPGCSQEATDPDAESLRSAILTANSEQEKIAVASGAFAMKCFTVGQIRVLAGLFVSDKAKFRLMEAARPHVSDFGHFRELADMYTDKNFQHKFLTLVEKRS